LGVNSKGEVMSSLQTIFIYQNAKGNVTGRVISDISETETYLQGFCHQAKGLRTFRKDRILEMLNSSEEIQSKLAHYISLNPDSSMPEKAHYLLDVCFTGFKSADKNRLIALAESKDLVIRGSVTRSLNFLCCGYNAGPKKIEKARSQGVIALYEQQFVQLLETGEVPDS
jgi:NAD-dependent DNA ligase